MKKKKLKFVIIIDIDNPIGYQVDWPPRLKMEDNAESVNSYRAHILNGTWCRYMMMARVKEWDPHRKNNINILVYNRLNNTIQLIKNFKLNINQ